MGIQKRFRDSRLPLGLAAVGALLGLVACENEPPMEELDDGAASAESSVERQDSSITGKQWVIQKLESTVIPSVNFEDTTIEDAIEFFRMRMAELDPDELDPAKKGIGFVLRVPAAGGDSNLDESLEAALEDPPLAGANAGQPRLTFHAKDISAADLLVRICEEANLNCYLTSRGFRVQPAEEKINVAYENSVGIEVWKVYHEAEK